MIFNKRDSAPSKNDVHYYSDNNVFYKSGLGMPNCTAYAWGRFYELMDELGIEGTPKLQTSNAENWFVDEHTYLKGSTPKLGAVIVWSCGGYHIPSDGAGHVGIVEEIKSDGSIIVSQSAYRGREFYLTEHNNRYEKSGYKFDGFIYLPKEFDKEEVNEYERDEFNIGDKVLVLSGYATADSYGGGSHTAEYDGNINDLGNIKYITKIVDLTRPRPYHISNDKENTKPRGWVSREQLRKL